MVKAINSGGEAQSIADFMVLESQPDRMVEVTKMMVFSDLPTTDPRKVGFYCSITLLASHFPFYPIFLYHKISKNKSKISLVQWINLNSPSRMDFQLIKRPLRKHNWVVRQSPKL